MTRLTINGKTQEVDVEPEMPLLWVLRDELGPDRHQIRLRHRPVRRLHRACRRRSRCAPARCRSAAVAAARSRRSRASRRMAAHPVQKAWIAHDVPQCGYCQTGMIMAAAALLRRIRNPTDADIDARDDQYLPLRHLCANPRGDPCRGPANAKELSDDDMQHRRRDFLKGIAAAGGGLALGFHLPAVRARPAGGGATAEVNAWVVIQPDDTVVIRVARVGDGAGHLDRAADARRRGARMRLDQGERRDSPRPTRTSAATASGARCRPAAAARSAPRRNTCARPAPPRARCWSPLRRSSGTSRRPNAASPTASSRMRASGRTLRFGAVADAAAKLDAAERRQAQGSEGLDADRQAAQKRLDIAGQGARQAGVRHRRRAARHALRLDRCNARCSAAA